jgi:PAS domain S-box-containing protein
MKEESSIDLEVSLLLTLMPDAVLAADRELRITHWNPAAESLLGYTEESILGLSILEVLEPSALPTREAGKKFSDDFDSNHTMCLLTRVKTSKGEMIPVEVSVGLNSDKDEQYLICVLHDITDRMAAEQAIRASERKYKAIADRSPFGILILQGQAVKYSNPAMSRILGKEPDEIISTDFKGLVALISPADRGTFLKYENAEDLGKLDMRRTALQIVGTGDRRRWIELHGSRVDYEGNPAVQVLALDITERKMAAQRLQKERALFLKIANTAIQETDMRRLTQIVLDAIAEASDFVNGTIRLYNKETDALELLASRGLDKTTLKPAIPVYPQDRQIHLGATVAEDRKFMFIPDTHKKPGLSESYPNIETLGIRSMVAWPVIGGSGELLAVVQLGSILPVEDRDAIEHLFETTAGMCATLIETAKTQKALSDSESRLRGIVSSLHEAFLMLLDKSGRINDYWCSTESEQRYGTKPFWDEESKLEHILSKSKIAAWRSAIQHVNQTGQSSRDEFRLRLDKGAFWFDIVFSPMKDDEGNVTGTVAVAIDITEEKLSELELRASYRDLELFASILSHDIRNDIQLILTEAEAQEILGAGQHELEQFRNSAKTAAKRIARTLTVLERGESEGDRTFVKTLEHAVKQASEIYPNLEISMIVPDTLGEQRVIAGLLVPTVFENLLRNSSQYGHDKTNVEIVLEQSHHNMVVHYSDDGPGIPDELREKLFHKGTSTSGGGLGLYLCRQVIRGYGGDIEWVKQGSLTGASFIIRLPLA